ncbi:unnamed protein product [Kluyveromyces dobzhanskii CBS 2104]|uniref:WGS project CCBQ000000000 data, contig 00015 n=1 Tax=Kluyveromyces dobzhanskii CBS 2104 TaxID=1427455 RepID=A0A0A8L8N4_9SACH|nr:unnamed protein product [Kluyveromyces dobzhanskii CBS 2104]
MDNHTELLTSLRQGQNGNPLLNPSNKENYQKDSTTFSLNELGLSTITEDAIELLLRVENLSLHHNNLTQLPGSFKKLTHLRNIDLSDNKFSEIPLPLTRCLRLESVDLSNNSISQIPQEFPEKWCESLVFLSLRNNKLISIKALFPIVSQLKNLRVLELDGNNFPNDVIEKVLQGFNGSKCSAEEYWIMALRKYFSDNLVAQSATSTASDTQQKITRAAKRMGFIGNSHTSEDNENKLSSPQSDLDLYSHSKFNEYFKRLSVLPEEPNLQEVDEEIDEQNYKELLQTHHEKKRKSMENVVLACRKLLFTFTECQQNIRKITSLCSEKTISVNVVSQLYSLKSHIDNLVEVLEQFETNTQLGDPSVTQTQFLHHDVLIRLCLTILSIFKKIFIQLRKNFNAFFGNNDVFFLRVFYMNTLCSYTEIFNAWKLLVLDNREMMKKKKIARTHSVHSMNMSQYQKYLNSKQKSSALNRSSSLSGASSQQSVTAVAPATTAATAVAVQDNGIPSGNQNSQLVAPLTHPSSFSSTPISKSSITPPVSDSSPKPIRNLPHCDQPNNLVTAQVAAPVDISSTSSQTPTVADTDIDLQLYHTLNTVIDMVNVVYSQLTQAITKSAIASTTSDQPSITPTVAAKTKELTDTCFQSMELSKVLKERLLVISNGDVDEYSATKEKLKTWEHINAFLKSIIAILANTKEIMSDLPTLNDVRPNLASLAKITKDVTVILDLSSYKSVSIANQQSSSNTSYGANTVMTDHTAQHQSHSTTQGSPSGQYGDNLDFASSNIITPLSTPSLVTSHNINPFDQLS